MLTVSVFAGAGLAAYAQSGEYLSYTPYSIYGIGDLSQQGSAYNRGMGGVGIASRNVKYLNSLNPAAVTARDSLSVMMDFSVANNNTLFMQTVDGQRIKSAHNSTNISSIAFSTPIWKNLAGMVGMTPYSSQGYGYRTRETDPVEIARNGVIDYYDYGQGSLYKLYGSAGYYFNKHLSVGAEFDYIFGNFNKYFTEVFEKSGRNTVSDAYDMNLHAITGKFGVQSEFNMGKKWTVGFGGTYSLASNLRGTVGYLHQSVGTAETITVSSSVDTLANHLGAVRIAPELGLGISVRYLDKFRAEVDYTRSDWRKSGMDVTEGFANSASRTPFTSSVRQSLRAGMEYLPNAYDMRYHWKRCSYRLGAYYNTEYYKVGGSDVNSIGITLGATIPIYQWYNGLSIGVDLGQRGTLDNSLIRERYVKVCVGVNIFDIWFLKYRYE